MIVIVIILGVLGLGLVVLVHELGHFAAARASGVEVEAFSIGWGPRVVSWKRGVTEWRISAIPLGGYCRMKGEEAFQAAIQNKAETIPREPGTFYGAPSWKRIIINLAGPLANVLFAAVVFVFVAAVGTTQKTYPNRIVLASEFMLESNGPAQAMPADIAGLRSGDIVLDVDGRATKDFSDLQDNILRAPDRPLRFHVNREGTELYLVVTPALDKDSGAGRIGVYPWIEPVVESVDPKGGAAKAGLAPGDRILTLNGRAIRHEIELQALLLDAPARSAMTFARGGETRAVPVIIASGATQGGLGLGFQKVAHVVKSANASAALTDGLGRTWSTFSESIQGLGLLFRGVNVLKAVSGPARITYFAGRIAVDSVSQNGAGGIVGYFDFLAFLSIALFIMNLLPIPALDGGMILLFVIETIRNRPLRTKTVYRFQFVGMAFILALFILAALSDILFFSGNK
jgi:regulator of sigma E protease